MRTGKAIALIAALAFLSVLPYVLFGYAGQDFEFHVASWMELRNAWLAGHLAPGWAGMANFGLGDPHLVLYPPLSFMLGAALSLLSFRIAPACFIWLAVSSAGAAMYFAAKPFLKQGDRLPAALLYMLSPYLVTTSLVRFAAAELLVQAWLPLILLCLYRAFQLKSHRATLFLGAILSLTWLTNIPESLILLYTLLATALLCAAYGRSMAPLLRFFATEAFAGALAAFYLLPLWFQRKWIDQAALVRSNPLQLLLFMRHSSGQETLKVFKYSCWLFACAGILLLLVCLRSRPKRLKDDPAIRTWFTLAAVAFCFQLPLSIPFWRYLPLLQAAEFPFRFLPFLGAALPLVLLAPGTSPTLRKPVYSIVALLTLLAFFQHIRLQTTASTRQPSFTALTARWQSLGYEGMPEYRPAGPNPNLAHSVAETFDRPATGANLPATSASYNTRSLTAILPKPGGLIRFPVFSYPFWHVTDQSGEPLRTFTASDGLLLAAAPPGRHTFTAVFVAASKARTLGMAVTLAALLVFALGCFLLPSTRFTDSSPTSRSPY